MKKGKVKFTVRSQCQAKVKLLVTERVIQEDRDMIYSTSVYIKFKIMSISKSSQQDQGQILTHY